MSYRIAVEQRRYAAGMAGTPGWQFETCWTSLHKNWKCALRTQENLRLYLCGCYMYKYWGDRTDTRLWEPLWLIRRQNRGQKLFTRRLYVCTFVQGGLILKICQNLQWFIVFPILLWGPWSFVCRGEAHQSTTVATGLNPPELPINDEARNDAHIASTDVKLH